LALELVELDLVDGQRVPIRTRLMEFQAGGSSGGRELGTVAVTTALGAAIGGAVDGGFGAGIGAIGGALAGTIGVLATRGRATVVYPEGVVRFRLEQPVTIDSQAAPEAFQTVRQDDYEPRMGARRPAMAPPPPPYPYYGWGYPSYYPFSPFYGSFFFYSGPRYFYGRGRFRRW
jgi:hypothetical protein